MKILFTFENPLPSREADAEVFITTAKYLGLRASEAWLHIPIVDEASRNAARTLSGMPVIPARAPLQNAALRHFCCGVSIPFREAFRAADLVYTRNLWVARLALLGGQKVVYDHYRPWPAQLPPLRPWIYALFCHPRLLANITHSEYTRREYRRLGIPDDKLYCVHNGFEPKRFAAPLSRADAKRALGIEERRKTIVYTGHINRKKGLELVVGAARRLPELLFLLVGSYGEGEIEALAATVANIRIVPWQAPEALATYVAAADLMLIPPSARPLGEFGSTVLPLKVFFYLASGHPILAGDTPDVREVLEHGRNAFLCRPDDLDSLVGAISTVMHEPGLASRLGEAARRDAEDFTWEARARKIAAIIEARMAVRPVERGAWSQGQRSEWVKQSGRWIAHLVRTGSWALTPGVSLLTPGSEEIEGNSSAAS